LKLVRAKQDIARRTVILGNAAHAIHPVGAQGFNLGLRDVAVLAELLADSSPGDPGEASLLQAYSKWRRPDHDSTISWSDGLTRLFANPSPLAATLRSAGMLAHALFPPLRRRTASEFMGYRGRVPKLALGERLAGAGSAER
jgi:2-octaprenyl-6-methoxyphenol hydroxylase